MTRTSRLIAALLAGLLPGAGGCQLFGINKADPKVQQQLQDCQAELQKTRQERDDLRTMTLDQQKQIASLQALGDKRLDKLYHVQSVELSRYTGGIDNDGKDGDDAIKVFLRPLDQNGDVVKAAGDVIVQMFDLSLAPKDTLIGQCRFGVDQVTKYWASGFLTYQYSFECGWKTRPTSSDVTVRVEFVDYLTGRHHVAQSVVKVKLPGQPAPATQPAPTTAPATKPK